jgi:hypothetical protein
MCSFKLLAYPYYNSGRIETKPDMMILNRPMDILIITGLNAIVGVILLLNALASPLTLPGLPSDLFRAGTTPMVIIGTILTFAGIAKLPLAIGFLGTAAGLFLGKGRAWSISRKLLYAGIGLGFAFVYGAGGDTGIMGQYVLAMALSGVIIGYLHTAQVREFYGMQPVPELPHKTHHKRKIRPAEEDIEEDIADVEEDEQPTSAPEAE